MRAMLLAAGRGERMGALTATQPKPLLTIARSFLADQPILILDEATSSVDTRN